MGWETATLAFRYDPLTNALGQQSERFVAEHSGQDAANFAQALSTMLCRRGPTLNSTACQTMKMCAHLSPQHAANTC